MRTRVVGTALLPTLAYWLEFEGSGMRSVSSTEFELKLELTPQQLQRIGGHPALEQLTVGKPVTRTLRSIYFDTPDHRLRAQGISLRLRSIGDQWVQTIKAGNGVTNGISQPSELEAVVGSPEPDLRAIGDRKIRRSIQKALKASTLEPQFETLITRTTHRLHSDKGDLELALDEGVVRTGNAEDKLCEAELELKAGPPECLLETATALFSSEAVRLAQASKADRGYDLVLGRHGEDSRPVKARHPVLEGGETCAEALTLFVALATEQIDANRRAVLETDDPEAAHQLRIGLRRLRSALRAFRPLDGTPAMRELELHARDLGQGVSALRNADVFIESIFAPVAGRMKGEPGFGELRTALLAHRAAKRDEARAALAGEQWSTLQLYLALWPRTVRHEGNLRRPVREFAAAALHKGWKKIAKQGADLDDLSPEQRHDMRKALKGFRYASEFFASLYDAGKVARFVKDLKKLQDVFGYVNDVATAREINGICHQRCGDSREAQRAAGYVLGWHEAEAGRTWKGVAKAWDRLRKRSRFWQ
jgi:inorganic triphosphatase YgiF